MQAHWPYLIARGRSIKDAINITMGSGVDARVFALATAYDTGGRPYLFTSYNSAVGPNPIGEAHVIDPAQHTHFLGKSAGWPLTIVCLGVPLIELPKKVQALPTSISVRKASIFNRGCSIAQRWSSIARLDPIGSSTCRPPVDGKDS